ncbi:MAG: glycoside hydrolase family 3 N-terminal domain-containing protein [Rikenellaceae bacterium]
MRKGLVLVLFVVLYGVGFAQEVSLEEKVGQLLVVGFKGYEPSAQVIEAIEEYNVGGVIFFDLSLSDKSPSGGYGSRNIESPAQLKRLVDSLQSIAQRAGLPELFIAIDQEGGKVNRLKAKYGFPESVSAEYLGQFSLDSTIKYSIECAQTLSSVGVNINFAPCVDLAVNPENPIIAGKERAFSGSSDKVISYSRAWIKQQNSGGIITSLKHFPGHGSSLSDSHHGLTDITSTWSSTELKPYEVLIGEGYDDIVMIGHLFNSNFDEEYPASLSKKTIDILRSEYQYDGVVATDDMNMGAIVEHYSLSEALLLALNAGVDMVVMGNNAKVFEADLVSRTHAIIMELVRSGRLSEGRIDEAYRRVMRLKERF